MQIIKSNGKQATILGNVETAEQAGKLIADSHFGKITPKTDTYQIRMETATDAIRKGERWFGRGNTFYEAR